MKELFPSNFQLSQNYPNPFKECTKIKYCLPFRTDVNLTICDSRGTIFKVLVNQIQEAGTYEVNFHRNYFPGGEYFCQIQAGHTSTSSAHGFQQVMQLLE